MQSRHWTSQRGKFEIIRKIRYLHVNEYDKYWRHEVRIKNDGKDLYVCVVEKQSLNLG